MARNMCKKCGSSKDNQQNMIPGCGIPVSTKYKTSQYETAKQIPQQILLKTS